MISHFNLCYWVNLLDQCLEIVWVSCEHFVLCIGRSNNKKCDIIVRYQIAMAMLCICALVQYFTLYSYVYACSFNVLLILFIHHRSRSHTHQPNWKLICTLSLDVTKFFHLNLIPSTYSFSKHFSGVFLPSVKKRFYFLVEYYKHILQSVCLDGWKAK